ncbi:MAG TPA: maleylacetoacetate isomerase, partial [Paracoccaceae bacterium]|nr:maleylacetoacetate isomerase [Paracoccaceae bacterium]
ELEDGNMLVQSLAIVEWLEETHPEPELLPADALGRARVRALSHMIALEIHPLNNLRVLAYIRENHGQDEDGVKAWFHHWVHETFAPLEIMLASSPDTGVFCHGDTPTMADCCLFAQMWNNKRFAVDTSPYPTIERIFNALQAEDAFLKAAPANQPDAI